MIAAKGFAGINSRSRPSAEQREGYIGTAASAVDERTARRYLREPPWLGLLSVWSRYTLSARHDG